MAIVGVHGRQRRRWRRATTSSGWISRTAASSRCSSASQLYPPDNPRPYDDTGWSDSAAAQHQGERVDDKSILDQPMTLSATGGLRRARSPARARTLVVDHTTDNTLVTFRFQNAAVKMSAAEQAFDLGGHHFAAGRVHHSERRPRRARAVDQGDRACRRGRPTRPPNVPMHDLDVPRIGYIHSWHEHAGRGLGAHRPRHVQGPVHLLRRQRSAQGQPARRSST